MTTYGLLDVPVPPASNSVSAFRLMTGRIPGKVQSTVWGPVPLSI